MGVLPDPTMVQYANAPVSNPREPLLVGLSLIVNRQKTLPYFVLKSMRASGLGFISIKYPSSVTFPKVVNGFTFADRGLVPSTSTSHDFVFNDSVALV